MPQNGRIVKWSKLRFTLSSTGTVTESVGDGFARYIHDADARTNYVPNSINVNVGITLHAESSFDGTLGVWQAYYRGPGASGVVPYIVSGSGFLNTVSIEVVINGFRMYCGNAGSLFTIFWDSVEVSVNGGTPVALPDSGGSLESAGVGPNYIPLFGMPMKGGGGCNIVRDGVEAFFYNQCNPEASTMPHWSVAMTGSQGGGWDFMEEGGDTYQALPVTVYYHAPTAGINCPFGLDASAIVTGTTTASCVINSNSSSSYLMQYVKREDGECTPTLTCFDADGNVLRTHSDTGPAQGFDACTGTNTGTLYRDIFKITTTASAAGGSCRIVPDLPKGITRLGDSYRALWYRFPFPQVTAGLSQQCVNDGASNDGFAEIEVYPAESAFLGCVGSSTHAIEDVFSHPTYGATQAARRQSAQVQYFIGGGSGPMRCPPTWFVGGGCPEGTVEFTIGCAGPTWPSNPSDLDTVKAELSSIVFPLNVTHTGSSQSHADQDAEYLAQWAAPHWNFAFWASAINCLGGPQDWKLYGGPIKQQWNYHPSLPDIEKRKTRNSMCLSPVRNDNGNTPWQDHFNGGMGWIGVSRFQVAPYSMPADLTLSPTRMGEWIIRKPAGGPFDCSIDLTNAGGPILSAFQVPTARVELLFASSFFEPYWQGMLAKAVAVDWVGTNVSAIKVSVVGIDDATTELGTAPGTYTLPQGSQVKYAQSLAEDNGAGDIVDVGLDQLANGISAAIMGMSTTAANFELAAGRAYYSLRFDVTPTDPTAPVTLKWPKFFYPNTHPVLFRENSKVTVMLWPDGPGIRLGQSVFWDPIRGYLVPPDVGALQVPHSVVDGLSDARILFEGVNPGFGGSVDSDTLTTVLGRFYDDYEGPSVGQVDDFSLVAILPKGSDETVRFALINSFSEVPPMPCWPSRSRDRTAWAASGAYSQITYDMCEENRPVIGPGGEVVHVTKPDGVTNVETPLVSPPSGWYVATMAPALVGDEARDWLLRKDGSSLVYTKLDPWYGIFCNLLPPSPAGSPDNLHDFCGQYYRCDISGHGDVNVRRAAHFVPPFVQNTVAASGVGASSASITIEPNFNRLKVVYDKPGGGLYARISDDNAKTFGEESLVLPGATHVTTRSKPYQNVDAGYISGTIQAVVRNSGDATSPAAITFKVADGSNLGVENEGFSLCASPDGADRWILSCKVLGETELSEWFSTDSCRTWTRVTT